METVWYAYIDILPVLYHTIFKIYNYSECINCTLFEMDLIGLAVPLLVVLKEVYFLQAQRGKG